MRFPTISDVAAELRRINKNDSGDDDGIDVRLQVYPDGEWAVRWGLSDYDQDHRGFWGSSSVPGDNRRFSSTDVARDLIEQAREHKAEGGGLNEAPRAVRAPRTRETSRARESDDESYIQIPVIERWRQISGDMDPGTYGGLIARSDGDRIDLIEIQPVREMVGDDEAADVGFPFWTKEATYDLDDLDPNKRETKSAIDSMDLAASLEEMAPPQRALAIAEALMRYGKSDEGVSGWSKDVVPTHDGPIEWWGGPGGPEFLADEDDEFRREILGEDDEDDDDGEGDEIYDEEYDDEGDD